MQKIAIDKTKIGWDQVTDIPCIIAGCPGLLRWAEAGYVPGYRICDCCGSHYALADCGDCAKGLKIERRMRPSPAKIAKLHVARGTAQKAAEKFERDWLVKNTVEHNARWAAIAETCSHGLCVNIPWEDTSSASGCLIEEITPDFARLIKSCWVLTQQLRASSGDFGAQILHATRDGKYVMAYQVNATYGAWDGWWDVEALREAMAAGWPLPRQKMTAEQRKAIGVFR